MKPLELYTSFNFKLDSKAFKGRDVGYEYDLDPKINPKFSTCNTMSEEHVVTQTLNHFTSFKSRF